MKLKLLSLFAIVFFAFSCKNDSKEKNADFKSSSKPEKEVSSEDGIKEDSSNVNLPTNDLVENKRLLLEFFAKNDKKSQFFLINNNKDTTIVCAEKTRITIKANSFVEVKTGNEVRGKIKISVKEYYKISDILLGRLSTTSNGKLLETGGMLDISANFDGEKCDLKNGKTIDIEFPRTVEKKGMQLFAGSWKKDLVNWDLVKNSVELNQTFSEVDEKPTYPGGFEKMYQFLGRNIYLQNDESVASGKIYTSFIIDKEGNVTDIKIVKTFDKNYNETVIRALKKLSKFTPGKVKGVAVNTFYSLPITFTSSDEDGNYSGSSSISTPYKPISYTEKTFQKAGSSNLSYYLFSSSKLGMINCDRFYDYDEALKINYVLNFENNSDTSVGIIFHRFKSIMRNNSNKNSVSFYDVPISEKITIFALKYFGNKPFLAIKETTISAKAENDLVFEPVTLEELKNEIKQLDRFN